MKILRIPLVIVLAVVAGRAFNANARTETNPYSFVAPPNDGINPYAGLVQGSDGKELFCVLTFNSPSVGDNIPIAVTVDGRLGAIKEIQD